MANIIGFKEDVDKYYRHYNQEGSWARVLASANRAYGGYNQQQIDQANQQNLNVINYAQSEVSKLYSQYQASKKALNQSGFTGALKSQAGSIYGTGTGAATTRTAQEIATKNMVTPQLADVNQSAQNQAYQTQVAGTAQMSEDIFGFLTEQLGIASGKEYTIDDLVKDGYLVNTGDGYELSALGKNKFSELSQETETGNQFETYLKDKYGDKYNAEEASYYGASAGEALGMSNALSGDGSKYKEPVKIEGPYAQDYTKNADIKVYANGSNGPVYVGVKPLTEKDVSNSIDISGRRYENFNLLYNFDEHIIQSSDGKEISFTDAIKSGEYDNVVLAFTDANGDTRRFYIREGKVYLIKIV